MNDNGAEHSVGTTNGTPAVRLEGISLCYRLARQRLGSFKEYFIHFLKGTLTYEELWALVDLDVTIERGEIVGIIGRNGAGKSTLSKVISGVLAPTRGRCRVDGKVAAILELGTGFDAELTGRENIFLNALLRGHRRREIEERLDAIIDFSGLGHFIDSPIRNYSTGMLARLGFSIATAWVPEVLILDEVLAVGDARFLARCLERLQNFREAGTTILLISHSPDQITDNCTRCLWLEQGALKADGDPKAVVNTYLAFARDGADDAPEQPIEA